jgi:hypothetical protein
LKQSFSFPTKARLSTDPIPLSIFLLNAATQLALHTSVFVTTFFCPVFVLFIVDRVNKRWGVVDEDICALSANGIEAVSYYRIALIKYLSLVGSIHWR